VTRYAQLVLVGVAVVAIAGLVLAQRLKGEHAYVRRVHVTPLFTPNGDRFRDRATIQLKLGESDRVSVTILAADGRPVRHLVTARPQHRDKRLTLRWYGRTDAGMRAPQGTYEVRVVLAKRNRTIDLLDRTRLRVLPPHGSRHPTA
jgi:hypothetical protein